MRRNVTILCILQRLTQFSHLTNGGRRVEMPAAADRVNSCPDSWASRNPRILVAEKDLVTCQMLTAALTRLGFSVRTTCSAPDALDTAREYRPDLVVAATVIEGGSGLDLCRWMECDPSLESTSVILLADRDALALRTACLAAGAVDCIAKPFAMRELVARVRTHVRLKRGQDALLYIQSERIRQLGATQQASMPTAQAMPQAKFHVVLSHILAAGGDFYDVLEVGADTFDYVVADATGHDLAASFWTAALKSLLTEYANIINSPPQILRKLNNALLRLLPAGVFFTMIYARLNRSLGHLQLVNAGHPPPILLHRLQGVAEVFTAESDVLGAFQDAVFDYSEAKVAVGDRLFLYSDGLIGGQSTPGNLPWEIASRADAPLGKIMEDISRQQGPTNVSDDIVLLGIEI